MYIKRTFSNSASDLVASSSVNGNLAASLTVCIFSNCNSTFWMLVLLIITSGTLTVASIKTSDSGVILLILIFVKKKGMNDYLPQLFNICLLITPSLTLKTPWTVEIRWRRVMNKCLVPVNREACKRALMITFFPFISGVRSSILVRITSITQFIEKWYHSNFYLIVFETDLKAISHIIQWSNHCYLQLL